MIAPLVLAAATLVSSPQAAPGDVVTLGVHTKQRAVVRVYLVPATARGVRSALDPRLHYIGSARPRNGRVTVSFRVPPLNGRYRAWCAGCGFGGRLQVTMPSAQEGACPVTVARSGPPPGLSGVWYGNDALWTHVPEDGILTARPQDLREDGSIWTKWFWFAAGIRGSFTVAGERIDVRSRGLIVHQVNEGTMTGFKGSGTWATPMTFPTQGCWRLTARVTNLSSAVSLSFVMRVTAA